MGREKVISSAPTRNHKGVKSLFEYKLSCPFRDLSKAMVPPAEVEDTRTPT